MVKTSDLKAPEPAYVVEHNPDRKFMTKAEAVADQKRITERHARMEKAAKEFDVEKPPVKRSRKK